MASQARSDPVDDQHHLLQSQQRAIAFLVSEKAALTAELAHLEGLESGTYMCGRRSLPRPCVLNPYFTAVHEKESLLEQERSRCRELSDRVQQFQADSQAAVEQIRKLRSTERDLADKCREQVRLRPPHTVDHLIHETIIIQDREIYSLNSNLTDLRAEAESHLRRVRELEDRIQSDDRVERLEASLRNTQDRADELDFQLSRLKQVSSLSPGIGGKRRLMD